MKYRSGMTALAQDGMAKLARNWRDVRVVWLWGETGTGKTRAACSGTYGDDWFIVPPDTRGAHWFDGYSGQKTIIFDDVDPTWQVPRPTWLRWLDGHALQVPVKGGFHHALWTTVVITSNFCPEDALQQAYDAAIGRRITQVKRMRPALGAAMTPPRDEELARMISELVEDDLANDDEYQRLVTAVEDADMETN